MDNKFDNNILNEDQITFQQNKFNNFNFNFKPQKQQQQQQPKGYQILIDEQIHNQTEDHNKINFLKYNPVTQNDDNDYNIGVSNQRYYLDETENVFCYRCKNHGHQTRQCKIDTQNCFFCLKNDHLSYQCQQILCFKCQNIGHYSKDCPGINHNFQCQQCKKFGHLQYECQVIQLNKQNQKIAPNIICLNCQQKGHINCSKSQQDNLYQKPKQKKQILNYFEHLDNQNKFQYSSQLAQNDRIKADRKIQKQIEKKLNKQFSKVIINDKVIKNKANKNIKQKKDFKKLKMKKRLIKKKKVD